MRSYVDRRVTLCLNKQSKARGIKHKKQLELSDYGVCITWGAKEKHLYLLQVTVDPLGPRRVKIPLELHIAKLIVIGSWMGNT